MGELGAHDSHLILFTAEIGGCGELPALCEDKGLSCRLLDSLQHLRQRHSDLAINACWHHAVPVHTDPLVSTPGMAATTQQPLLRTKA